MLTQRYERRPEEDSQRCHKRGGCCSRCRPWGRCLEKMALGAQAWLQWRADGGIRVLLGKVKVLVRMVVLGRCDGMKEEEARVEKERRLLTGESREGRTVALEGVRGARTTLAGGR